MTKLVAWLSLFASIVVPHAAIAQQDSGAIGAQRIQTEELVLQIPATWVRLNDTDTVLTLLSPIPPTGDSFRDNIRVKKYPLAGVHDLDRIHSVQEQSVGDRFKVIGSGVLSTGEPRITWLATSQKQPEPGQALLAKVDYLMINQEHLFVLHAMCKTSALNECRPTFDAIARSVRFTRSSSTQQTTAPKTSGSRHSKEFEQGKEVGRYTFYAMVAVVGAWLILRVVKFVRK
jgi:hypothetical protein